MGKHDDLPFWLQFDQDIHFSDDGDDDSDGDNTEDEDDAGDEDADEEDDDTSSKDGKDGDDTSGLKSALKKERAERKKLEKEAKKLRKATQAAADKDKSETDKAKEESARAAEKATRLAQKLLENAVDTEIIKAVARVKLPNGAKFADVDDALKLIDRRALEVEQDEDDPDEIEIDSDSVEKALKKLAKNKPHLLIQADSSDEDEDDDEDDDEEPTRVAKKSTGSKVGSRGTRDKGKIKEDELKRRYPMLAAGTKR